MSDLLRLARELDKQAANWLQQSEWCAAEKCLARAKKYRGRHDGLKQASEMAKDMHNHTREACDVAAGDVSGG